MAIEIKKSGAIRNTIDEVDDHDKRLAVSRDRMFADNDAATIDSIIAIYDTNREKIAEGTDDQHNTLETSVEGTDDRQIMLLSTLHAQREFMGWFLGEALMLIDAAITSGEKSGYNSLNDWINRNEGRLGFSKRTAYAYIQIREASTLEQFQKLGVKKTLIVAQLKDPKKREAVIKTVSAPRVTVEETKKQVEQVFAKEREKIIKKREVLDERAKEIKMSITLNGPRQIIFEFHSQRERDLFNDLIQPEVMRLKKKVAEQLIADKIPPQR